jgi:hypothetical protein
MLIVATLQSNSTLPTPSIVSKAARTFAFALHPAPATPTRYIPLLRAGWTATEVQLVATAA